MSSKLAIVFCVHHKPWLMMATLLTTVIQDRLDADFYFVYNLGDGTSSRESYREYEQIATTLGVNRKLSPFDERVREVCRLRRTRIFELEYENDHALDSGAWYKFIREGHWRAYERVLFLGEGAILAHPRLLSALVDFTERRHVHFVASGHEKRRIPRDVAEGCHARGVVTSPIERFHGQQFVETFRIFCRDPKFKALYERWGSDFSIETENHVPNVSLGGALPRRMRARIQQKWGSPFTHPHVSWPGRTVRRIPLAFDRWASQASMWVGHTVKDTGGPVLAYHNGIPQVVTEVDAVDAEHGVHFHRERGPEWFGCAALHLLSRDFLLRLSEKLDQFEMYDALDMPFAGSPLEHIWGFLPAWLGFEKWFTDGFHRVRKQFTTYQREDYPPEMAGYINRYHRGRLVVGWHEDHLKLQAWRSDLGDLRQVLPAAYF